MCQRGRRGTAQESTNPELLAERAKIHYISRVNPESRLSAAAYVTDLAATGRYAFTTEQAVQAIGAADSAVRAALRRLDAKQVTATPVRGFHVVVPPEYRRLGCLPPEQFVPQLMANLGLPYYFGLLSAAQYHGAAHQRPQTAFVVVEKNRDGIQCGAVRVAFVARKNAALIPTASFNTPRGAVRVSSAEATAFDLVGYVDYVGGLSAVATVLADLAERIDADKLAAAASLAPLTWAQRLGHLMDIVGAGERTVALAAIVDRRAREYVPLAPERPCEGSARDKRWRILVNAEVEPDA